MLDEKMEGGGRISMARSYAKEVEAAFGIGLGTNGLEVL